MNIWWVNHFAVPPTQAGGTRQFSFARALERRGHHVLIVASSVDYLTRTDRGRTRGEEFRAEMEDGVEFMWLKTAPYRGSSWSRLWNMLSFTRRVHRCDWGAGVFRPDVIIGSTPHPFGARAALSLAVRLKVPFVLEVRDIWPQSLVDLGGYSRHNLLVKVLARMEKTLCSRATAVVTLLPGSMDHLASRGAPPERTVWVPNGIDLSTTPPPQEKSADGGHFVVMYAGAHGMANGLDAVLDAAKGLIGQRVGGREAVFMLVGDGQVKKRLQRRVVAECISNVVLEPPVPKREVQHKLAQADAFILPLKPGGVFQHGISPNKLFEYMAAARPIIFATGATGDPVAEARAGISVPAGDAEAIAGAITTLMGSDAKELRLMGQNGRCYVEQNHDISALTEHLEAALISACGA